MKFLTQNNLLMRLSSKVVVTVGLLFVLFAPTMQMFETPIAMAQDALPGAYTASGAQPVVQPQAGDIGCLNGNFAICVSDIVYVFTVSLGSGLAFVGAYFFDITVNLSLNSYAYALDFISQGWTAVRDIANMAFILILVYIAYIILLEAEGAGTMQLLAWVIFIALIINFSFFLTRIVIDAGNIVAVQFYNSINANNPNATLQNMLNGAGATGTAASTAIGTVAGSQSLSNTKDLTFNIMQGLNIQGAFNTQSFNNFYNQNNWLNDIIILSFLYISLGVMFFMLAGMLITAGIKFMFRIVMLWFAIISAPLALLTKAIPKQGKYFDQWLKMLVQNAFYPAVFLFVFILISNFFGSISCQAGQTTNCGIVGGVFDSLAALGNNSTSATGFVYLAVAIAAIAIRMGILLAMLYVAMKASDAVSSYGAGAAHAVTNWATRKGTSLAFGGAGALGRATIGRGGYIASNSQALKNLEANKYVGGIIGRPLRATLGGLGRSSYDARGVGLVTKGLGKLDIDVDKAGGKGGFEKTVKDRAKNVEDRAKELKENTEAQARAAQVKFQNDYDAKNGSGEYKARTDELSKDRKGQQNVMSTQLTAQRQAALTGNTLAANAAREAYNNAKKREKDLGDELGTLEGGGKKILENTGKARVRAFAERIGKRNWQNLGFIPGPLTGPSRGSLEGAAKATKLVTDKPNKDKLADIVKDIQKEEGGDEAGTPAATATPAGPAPASHPLTRSSLDATRQKFGSLDAASGKLLSAIEKQTEVISQGNKRTFVASKRMAEALNKGLKDVGGQVHSLANENVSQKPAPQTTERAAPHSSAASASTTPSIEHTTPPPSAPEVKLEGENEG